MSSHPDPEVLSRLSINRSRVLERIRLAARGAGRDPSDVQLLAVTKSVDLATIRALVALGESEFGENRADALVSKAEGLGDPTVRWHFVGPIQRNKVRKIVAHASILHSLDSTRLIGSVQRVAAELGRTVDGYLQVWLSGERSKQGLLPSEVAQALEAIDPDGPLRPVGLMTMGPLEDASGERTRRVFAQLQAIGQELESSHHRRFRAGRCLLSMGMSGDLEWAVASGSTLVRIGTDLFHHLPHSAPPPL
ncbi:MAG: YggS family pyridoxal phosphate-dependent enzyme [Planctomycetes bacterium]|nr:YggS family pyridoxal phosphate-dependent enzyme [Planctomycetota bacterium]MCB9909173.1 YggS family pyridoxal phosphate-dependent enzyme [Planctomycetota bacterium]